MNICRCYKEFVFKRISFAPSYTKHTRGYLVFSIPIFISLPHGLDLLAHCHSF